MGIRNTIFIDDQSVLGQGFDLCSAHTQIALSAYENAGWVVNVKKSCEPPVQNMEFLGLMVNSVDMKYYVPESKKQSTYL